MLTLFLLAFTISFFTLLGVIYYSHKYSLFIDCEQEDKPQKFHDTPVPRAGGIGIVVALMMLSMIPFGLKLIPSILLAFVSGIFEDFHNSLTPRIRIIMQVLAAVIAIWLTHSVVTYLGLGITLPYILGVVFSIFAIVGMSNAINIIDGFNGLASGIILLILASFAYVSFQHHNETLLEVISIISGATFGFFVLVFPKGKIFLGDGGAYLLGFIVALLGIFLAGTYKNVSPWYVLAVFIYPVWEVIFSILRKTYIGRSPMQPDDYHFHMLVHRQITKHNPLTALFILTITAPFMLYATLHAKCSLCNLGVVLLFIVSYVGLYFYLYRKEMRQ